MKQTTLPSGNSAPGPFFDFLSAGWSVLLIHVHHGREVWNPSPVGPSPAWPACSIVRKTFSEQFGRPWDPVAGSRPLTASKHLGLFGPGRVSHKKTLDRGGIAPKVRAKKTARPVNNLSSLLRVAQKHSLCSFSSLCQLLKGCGALTASENEPPFCPRRVKHKTP